MALGSRNAVLLQVFIILAHLFFGYKLQHSNHGTEDPRDPRFYNFISEKDALMYEACQDVKKSVSTDHSEVKGYFRREYYIGDVIKAIAILYDGNGKRKFSGGDQLRAKIENKLFSASAPCLVTDTRNGTHMITCEALWSGTSTIIVTLAYTREAITSIYRIRTKLLSTISTYGKFMTRHYTESTICHPNSSLLLKLTTYTELCNMTYINSGMPFYCGKPTNSDLICQDLQQFRHIQHSQKLPITACEQTLVTREQRSFKQNVQVTVRGQSGDRNKVISLPSIPCSEYNVSLLWHSRMPTGFFYNGSWILRHCLGSMGKSNISCLKNRRVYLFGDSTVRQWFEAIVKRFRCQPLSKKWMKENWHKSAECYNKEYNFSVGWYPHSQPFIHGNQWEDVRYSLYSIARRIDDIPRDISAIVLVHTYVHLLGHHHNIFQLKMKIIRTSIEKFIKESKQSIVMIKGPHLFKPNGGRWASDYYGYVYSKILYEVFNNLHDKVVLLNNKDATQMQPRKDFHPHTNVVNAMVDQMFSYACKN